MATLFRSLCELTIGANPPCYPLILSSRLSRGFKSNRIMYDYKGPRTRTVFHQLKIPYLFFNQSVLQSVRMLACKNKNLGMYQRK